MIEPATQTAAKFAMPQLVNIPVRHPPAWLGPL